MQTHPFKVGDKVVDRDGFHGVVRKITEWDGSRWYDVRFASGDAVRYDADLRLDGPKRSPGKLVYRELPAKTYASRDNAVKAFVAACTKLGVNLDELAYLVACDADEQGRVRFFPVALPKEDQLQRGIFRLAHAGVMIVRT